MKRTTTHRRKEHAARPVGATFTFGMSHEESLEVAAQHAQKAADTLGEDLPIVNGFTGQQEGLVRPRRKQGTSVSLSGLDESAYERIFKHTNFRGGKGKTQ